MDTDEKLKQEQLEYYKRENELRKKILKRKQQMARITLAGMAIIAILIIYYFCQKRNKKMEFL